MFVKANFVSTSGTKIIDPQARAPHARSKGKKRGEERGRGRRLKESCGCSSAWRLVAATIQAVVLSVDHHYYGRTVSPICNIFAYIAAAGGDKLYGVEPLSDYLKNITLNFNLVGLLGLLSLPLLTWRMRTSGWHEGDVVKFLGLAPIYLWLGIVVSRPHKEERFLFLIYPMVCFGVAVAMDEILDALVCVVARRRPKKKGGEGFDADRKLLLGLLVLSPAAIVSISRSLALHHNYATPLALYRHLFHRTSKTPPPNNKKYYVCTGGEWYRFNTICKLMDINKPLARDNCADLPGDFE